MGFSDIFSDYATLNYQGMFDDITGQGNKGDRAAQDMMEAQLNEARGVRSQAMGIANQTQNEAMDLSKMTPQELAAYGKSLDTAQTNLQSRQKLLDSVDPALMEASKQVLSIMKGGATAGTPARDAQRAQLVNQLRGQYGPGAENTSIGQKALMAFDNGTLDRRNTDLATNMGVLGFGQSLQAGVDQGIGVLSGAGNNFSNVQNRMLGTRLQTGASTLAALTGTSQPVINAAGAPYLSDYLSAQRSEAKQHDAMNFVGSVFGMGRGSGGGGGGGMGGGGGYGGGQQGGGYR